MDKKTIMVKFHRQGYSGPIWGMFPNDDTLLRQYPAPTIEKALDVFLIENIKELIAQGYTHFVLPTGEEIPLS